MLAGFKLGAGLLETVLHIALFTSSDDCSGVKYHLDELSYHTEMITSINVRYHIIPNHFVYILYPTEYHSALQ